MITVTSTESHPSVYTIDFGISESDLAHRMSYAEHFNIEAMKLGVLGVTVVAVAGTSEYLVRTGSTCIHDPMFPASSPFVTAVSSTVNLIFNDSDKDQTKKSDEQVGSYKFNAKMISSGGFSTLFSSPSYQQGSIHSYSKNMNNLRHSTHNVSGRGYPDISMLNSNYMLVSENKRECLFSPRISAYLFSSMVSQINIARERAGLSHLGFLNPALYVTHDKNSSYIRDIASSEIECVRSSRCCVDGISAAVGWDPVSGIGSVDLDMMYKHFAGAYDLIKLESVNVSINVRDDERAHAIRISNVGVSASLPAEDVSSNSLKSNVSSLAASTSYYYYTGSYQVYEVPSDVHKLTVSAYGGQGGSTHTATGGAGGHISVDISVTPGQLLFVYVGGAGGATSAGYNGGGMAYDADGGGGGGASDVRTSVGDLYSRIVVAGGGGGGGFHGSNFCMDGGSGGGYAGGSGVCCEESAQSFGGGGGTLYSGGTAGHLISSNIDGSPGSYGYGGDARDGTSGGGGGGGYHGGGGGAWTGGGGGSSYALGVIRANERGVNDGDGMVSIQGHIDAAATMSSAAGVFWVQGQLYQSCSAACASVSSYCTASGPWPITYSDFITIYLNSVDLSTCKHLPAYGDCSTSTCYAINQGSILIPQDPEGDGYTCYYGGGLGTCDALPDGSNRRFCPCFGSIPLSYPTIAPTKSLIQPTTRPTKSTSMFWVQGQLYQSCSAACASVSSYCTASGPWPITYSDFITIYLNSVDLSTCKHLPAYGDCSTSTCYAINQGSILIPQDPEGDGYTCYYGGGLGTCDALPDGSNRRFCPCFGHTPTLYPTVAVPTMMPTKASLKPTSRPTMLPTMLPTKFPTKFPTMFPVLTPSLPSIPLGIFWVQGQLYQSCSAACASVSSYCMSSGPWPITYSDFYIMYSNSVDLSTCKHLPAYGDCSTSTCYAINQGVISLSQDPEGDGYSCYYGGGAGTCDALPDGSNRRFCPCLSSSSSPSIKPTSKPVSPSSLNVLWVQGQLYQSCSAACASVSSYCMSSGPWPITYSDFYIMYSNSVDLSTCKHLPAYGDCSTSTCYAINQGVISLSQDPEGDGYSCYYGGGAGTCDALPDGLNRRFCPCGLTVSSSSSIYLDQTIIIITVVSLIVGFICSFFICCYCYRRRKANVALPFINDIPVLTNEKGIPTSTPPPIQVVQPSVLPSAAVNLDSVPKRSAIYAVGETKECVVCFQNIPQDQKAIVCRAIGERNHWMHKECFSQHVLNQVAPANRVKFQQNDRRITCPNCFGAYEDTDITYFLADELREIYVEARDGIQRQITGQEMEKRLRMEEERGRIATRQREGRISRHKKHILENIVILSCPRCRKAISDFQEGDSFAIRCTCSCSFCGWCFMDCWNDAQSHVRTCPENPRPNDLYGSVQEFYRHHNDRRRQNVLRYVNSDTVAVEDRPFVIEAVRRDIRNKGIEIN